MAVSRTSLISSCMVYSPLCRFSSDRKCRGSPALHAAQNVVGLIAGVQQDTGGQTGPVPDGTHNGHWFTTVNQRNLFFQVAHINVLCSQNVSAVPFLLSPD